jgi:ABC-2 type transport system permease protein
VKALAATNVKATVAQRGAFWLQVAFMALNNFTFFLVWILFFDRFEEIGGWRLSDMAALYGVCSGSFGLAVILAGGMRDLARTIADGDLDPFLTQPKDVLLHVLGSRSFASGWGDLASAFVFLGFSGHLAPATLPVVLTAFVTGAVVFVAAGILVHSLAFWLGPVNDFARQAWEMLIAFSVYPHTIYGPVLRVLLLTLVPAGFIGYVPVETLRHPSAGGLLAMLGGAAAFLVAARVVFRRGLSRYESGNRFGVRA